MFKMQCSNVACTMIFCACMIYELSCKLPFGCEHLHNISVTSGTWISIATTVEPCFNVDCYLQSDDLDAVLQKLFSKTNGMAKLLEVPILGHVVT